jgi:Terminase DNA packaging enzyme
MARPKKLGPKESLEQALNMAAKELGIVTTKPELLALPAPLVSAKKETLEDYQFVRKTLKALIERGNDALEALSEIAEEGGAPREFEVIAILVKNISEATRMLIEIQNEMRDIAAKDKEAGNGDTSNIPGGINTNLSTAELLEMLKALPEGVK